MEQSHSFAKEGSFADNGSFIERGNTPPLQEPWLVSIFVFILEQLQ